MGQVVPLHYIPGSIFSWFEGSGVTEESTLEANGYNDFARELTIKSHKTGSFKTFYFTDEVMNEDGEVEAWIYKSKDGVEVHILND